MKKIIYLLLVSLIINLFASCKNTIYDVSDTWWFSFENYEYNCGSGLEIGYIEMFTWEKKKEKHCTISFNHPGFDFNVDLIIFKSSQSNEYVLKYQEGEKYGTLKMVSKEKAIVFIDNGEIKSKIKFYPNKKIGDPWDFYGNEDQYNDDMLCRQIHNIRELIHKGIEEY